MNIVPAKVTTRARIDGHIIRLHRQLRHLAARPSRNRVPAGIVDVALAASGFCRHDRAHRRSRPVRFARVRVATPIRCARATGFSVPDNVAGLVFDPSHFTYMPTAFWSKGSPDGQDHQPKGWLLVLPVFLVVRSRRSCR